MNLTQVRRQLALSIAFSLIAGASHAATSIVGDAVEIWGIAQLNGNEFLHDVVQVVDPGVEYTATIGSDIYNLNIGPSSITLITLDDWYSPWFNSGFPPTALEIRGIDVPGKPWMSIGGVSVVFSDTIVPEPLAPPGYPAFSPANAIFTADSVKLHIGPYSFPTGSRVHIDLTFIPEPAAAGMLAVGMAGTLALFRRLASRSSSARS